MPYRVQEETFSSLGSYWRSASRPGTWNCVFVVPAWLEVWWRVFGNQSRLHLFSVWQDSDLLGIAPLRSDGQKASFVGSPDVCDYQDFVVAGQREREFSLALLDHTSRMGISCLDLKALRPDSITVKHIAQAAKERGCAVSFTAQDVSLELDLPPTWEQYLEELNGKQRHEVRRKIRRLHEAGSVQYRVHERPEEIMGALGTFLELFAASGEDKEAFMTVPMESFFRSLAEALGPEGLLRLCVLELEGEPAAAILCFDYAQTVYLYNSGYAPRFGSLSVGVVCKAMSIGDSIKRGRKKYDFLKGAETYKYRMGGREVPLSGCTIAL